MALVWLLCGIPAVASDLASDLSGDFEAAGNPDAAQDPGAAQDTGDGSIDAFVQAVPVDPVNMRTADVTIGYVTFDYVTISPVYCNDWTMLSVNQLVYEPVVDLDDELRPIPMLADNWTQDGKTWQFNLRKGVQFHNGYELTAYDVTESFEAMRRSANCPYAKRLEKIKSMEASDLYTLTVEAADASYLTLYAMNFPVMQYSTINNEIPMGTGPYWYIQYDGDGSIRLEANPLWWKHAPGLGSILMKRYREAGQAIEAIQTNQIQMLTTRSPKASFSRKLADLTSLDYTTLTYECLLPNLSSGSLLSELNVRQAVMYAVDRATVASNAYVDMAVPCEVPVPPGSWLYETQSAIYYYSPERALQLMNNLGWYDMTGNGTLNQLEGIMLKEPDVNIVTYNEGTNSIRENAANLIAGYLNDVGFNATVTVLSKDKARDRIRGRDYDLALVGFNLSEVPLLDDLLGSGGSLNLNHYSNEAMDALLGRVSNASDPDELQRIYSEIQLTLVDRLPVLGMCFRTGTVLSSRSIGGLQGLRAFDSLNGFEFLK